MRRLLILSIVFFLTQTVFGQLVINQTVTSTQAANYLIGPGVTISNITMNCPAGAFGLFSGGNTTNIGLDEGLILTSGSVTGVPGPNNQTGYGQANNGAGDADLTTISGTNTFDACVLEFDLVATCDTIQIGYVFGSEEYPEYVGSINDAFGFFISGPGIAGTQNIALIPGTTTPVTINNVNNTTNSTYYIDNTGGTTIQYDGFTTVLLAKSAVIPCSTYHIKLAVADAVDQILDSGVFLEKEGIRCSSVILDISSTTSTGSANNVSIEGCIDGIFSFVRYGDTTVADTIHYLVGGTAVNGVDYPMIPSTIIFPPGQDSLAITVSGFDDGVVEGNETVYIILADTVCNTIFYDTATVIIADPPRPDAGPDQTICPGDSAFIGGAAAVPFNTYQWSPTGGVTNPTAAQTYVTGTNPGSSPIVIDYILTMTDTFQCQGTDTMTLTIDPPVVPNFNMLDTVCFGVPVTIQATGSYPPGTSFNWSYTGNPTVTGSGPGPLTANWPAPGTYDVSLYVVANSCTSATTTHSIYIAPPPVVDAGPPIFVCEGEGGDTLFGSTTGGTAPYFYTWWCDTTNTNCGLSNINNSWTIANPQDSTWYYVQVIDFNGCPSNIDSVFATVNPKPIVNAGPDVYICADSAPCIQLQASVSNPGMAPGPYTYSWSPSTGLNNPNIPNPCARPDTTTIYTVTVTDGNGCQSNATTIDTNATITVYVRPLPVANAGQDQHICFGDTVMLQGIGFNAGPVYNFEWSPATGLSDSTKANPLAYPQMTTDYILTVWSNACPSYGDTITVFVHDQPTVDAGADRDMCLNDQALLDGQVFGTTGDTAFSFLWTPNTGILGSNQSEDIIVSPDSTIMYYFSATSNWGCGDALDSVLVTIRPTPVADAGADQIICFGDSILLNGSYAITTTGPVTNPSLLQYHWEPAADVDNADTTVTWAYPDSTQWFYFTVDYEICSTMDSVLINVVPEIGANITADTSTICDGDSVQLHATGGRGNASFTWVPSTGLSDPSSTDPWASPSDSTEYMVIVEETGCADTARFMLNVLPTPDMAYVASQTEGCVPLTVQFQETAADAIMYVWDFGDGSPTVNTTAPQHTYSEPGTYTVTLTGTGVGGCEGSVSTMTIIVHDTAFADFESHPELPAELYLPNTEVEFHDHSANSAAWHWDFGDGATSTDRDPVHTYHAEGEYFVTLTVTNSAGCVASVTKGPFVVITPDVEIPNVFTPNGDGQNDEFRIRYTGSQPFTLTVFDRWGNKLFESNNKNEGWDGKSTTGNEMPAGIYFYTVKIGDKSYSDNLTLMR